MNLDELYQEVYHNLMTKGPRLFRGRYDATNGNEQFMYGVSMVMEYIASMAGDEFYEEFDKIFLKNMIQSKRLAEQRKASLPIGN